MKKTLLSSFFILLIINIALFAAKSLQSELTDITEKICVNKQKLEDISTKLFLIKPSLNNEPDELKTCADNVQESLTDVVKILNEETKFILLVPGIKDEYKAQFCEKRIEGLASAKQLINNNLSLLNYFYKNKSYEILLKQFDNPIEVINSTLDLIDKNITILQSLKNESNKKGNVAK